MVKSKDETKAAAGPTEDVVVKGRPLAEPAEEPRMGSAREVRERHRQMLNDERANLNTSAPVNAADAKIIPNIGQPRAQSSEEIRQDQEDGAGMGTVTKVAPYPGDPQAAHVRAIALSERQRDSGEFNTEDLTGHFVDGDGKTDTVVIRLLYDWWDGQGVRHPLNSMVEVPINEARNLVDQRKAERTDPLR